MQKKIVYGSIDIGGTKVRMGLVASNGQVVFRKMFLTPVKKQWQQVLDSIVVNFNDMLKETGIPYKAMPGIGIGCPGTFDLNREIIGFAPNLHWRDIPIKKFLSEKFPVPVWLENDVNVSTLGVARFGEGRSVDSLVGIFIGTGIGGGIILNKTLFIGNTGGAGEIGHMVVRQDGPQCQCGNNGCLEAITSTRAIYERIKRSYLKHYKGTETLENYLSNANTSLAVKFAYNSGEPNAVRLVDKALYSLGQGIVNIINVLNPQMVVLGGGLVQTLGNVIVTKAVKAVKELAMPGTFESVEIVASSLGDDAPIVGGAALVKQHLQS
ncbi:ROK family protein [candidate division KSB1 bacterium]